MVVGVLNICYDFRTFLQFQSQLLDQVVLGLHLLDGRAANLALPNLQTFRQPHIIILQNAHMVLESGEFFGGKLLFSLVPVLKCLDLFLQLVDLKP